MIAALAFQNADLLRALADPALSFDGLKPLADHLGRDKSNTLRTLKGLRADGVVVDGGFALTDKGRQILAGIEVAAGNASDGALAIWPLDRIVRNPTNRAVDPDTIPAMADSLAAQGQLQPITLTPVRDDGMRMLLIGERRWLGAKLAAEQGRLPDSLKDGLRFEEREATPAEALAITVVENVERQSIPPLELAFLLRDYADAAGEREGKPLDAKSVADRLGLGVRDVQDKIRIARQATPEAIAAYREHGSWDRLRDSVTEKKAAAGLPNAPLDEEATSARNSYLWSLGSHRNRAPDASLLRQEDPTRPSLADLLPPGTVIRTSYGSGPYTVESVTEHTYFDRFRAWSLTLNYLGLGRKGQQAWINEMLVEWEGDEPRFRHLFKANDDELFIVEDAAVMPADDPLVVNGVRYPNLTRANEARRSAGILPRQANHGGGSLKAVPQDLAQANGPSDGPIADGPAPAAGPLGARGRLALVEIAHKTGRQRRPLDPVHPAEWSGDADQDFVAFGCTCGPHWLDPHVQALTSLGLVRVVQIPGGHPPMLALTDKGAADLTGYGCPLPVADHDLALQRRIAGAPENLPAGTYVTPALAREAEPAPEPSDAERAAAHAAQLAADQPDPWDRTPEQVAEAEALLSRVLAFTCDDAEAEPTPGDTAGGLLALLGLRPAATITDQGGIRLETAEGLQAELVTVDAAGHHPDEYAKALAALIAWAIERAIGGEG